VTTEPLRSGWALLVAMLLVVGCSGGDAATPPPNAGPLVLSSTGKAIFLLEPAAAGSHTALREAIHKEITPQLAADARIERLVVSLPIGAQAADPAVASVVEVYGHDADLRAVASELEASLGDRLTFNAYLVSENFPRTHEQTWPDGTPTPGVRMIAIMIRHAEMTRAEFEAYWRDTHAPIALAHTVAVLNYSQNTVRENLTDGSDPIDGIVGEHFASASYSRDRMLKHPIQFFRGVRSGMRFSDLGQARMALMTETVIKSGRSAR
jgi:hypothetical protein